MTWKILEINCETGEQIERDPTPQEIKQKQLDENFIDALIKAENNKIDAKNALLERLGITEEEAKLLLA